MKKLINVLDELRKIINKDPKTKNMKQQVINCIFSNKEELSPISDVMASSKYFS